MLGSNLAASTDNSSTFTVNNVNPFLSKTTRGDMWMADRDAPYTRPSYTTNPGPNAYFDLKKKDDVKARLLSDETDSVPFGSKDERPLNKLSKNKNPGPGNYIDIYRAQNSSVSSKLAKIVEDKAVAES
jgi:hypothetical protein